MTESWRELKREIEAETERIRLQEPDEMKKVRFGLIESGAGSYGQYFTALDFVYHEVRTLGCSSLYGILKMADAPGFTLGHLKALLRVYAPTSAEFIGYCGFKKIWDGDDRSLAHHLTVDYKVAAVPPSVFYEDHVEEGRQLLRFAFCKKLETLAEASKRLKELHR